MKRKLRRFIRFSRQQQAFAIALALFVFSISYFTFQALRVSDALRKWSELKESHADVNSVKEALDVVNYEERLIIPPIGLVFVFSLSLLRLINPRIVPHQCFYCGRWMRGKHALRSPDGLFWYHMACQEKIKAVPLSITVEEPSLILVNET